MGKKYDDRKAGCQQNEDEMSDRMENTRSVWIGRIHNEKWDS